MNKIENNYNSTFAQAGGIVSYDNLVGKLILVFAMIFIANQDV